MFKFYMVLQSPRCFTREMTNRTLKQELVVINQNVIFKTSFIITLLIALVTFVSYSFMLTRFVLFHGCFGRSLELTLVTFKKASGSCVPALCDASNYCFLKIPYHIVHTHDHIYLAHAFLVCVAARLLD